MESVSIYPINHRVYFRSGLVAFSTHRKNVCPSILDKYSFDSLRINEDSNTLLQIDVEIMMLCYWRDWSTAIFLQRLWQCQS